MGQTHNNSQQFTYFTMIQQMSKVSNVSHYFNRHFQKAKDCLFFYQFNIGGINIYFTRNRLTSKSRDFRSLFSNGTHSTIAKSHCAAERSVKLFYTL